MQLLRAVDRLGGLPLPLELRPRAREAGGKVYGMSWLPGTTSNGRPEAAEEGRRALVLAPPAAVREVAA